MQEIMWGAYHIAEDEREFHDKSMQYMDLLISFVNPQLFNEYQKRKNSEEIINEDYDEEVKNKLGVTREQLHALAKETGNYSAEEVDDIDIFQEPMIIKGE